jgi:hypothetical protein
MHVRTSVCSTAVPSPNATLYGSAPEVPLEITISSTCKLRVTRSIGKYSIVTDKLNIGHY